MPSPASPLWALARRLGVVGTQEAARRAPAPSVHLTQCSALYGGARYLASARHGRWANDGIECRPGFERAVERANSSLGRELGLRRSGFHDGPKSGPSGRFDSADGYEEGDDGGEHIHDESPKKWGSNEWHTFNVKVLVNLFYIVEKGPKQVGLDCLSYLGSPTNSSFGPAAEAVDGEAEYARIHKDRRIAAIAAVKTLKIMKWLRKVDYIIEHFTKRKGSPNKALTSWHSITRASSHGSVNASIIKTTLRLGVANLIIFGSPGHSIPAHAKLAELASTSFPGSTPLSQEQLGFIKGVLLNVSKNGHTVVYPAKHLPPARLDRHKISALGVTHSHPDWMVKRWLHKFGFARCVGLLKQNNKDAESYQYFKVNPLKRVVFEDVEESLRDAGLEALPSRWLPHSIYRVHCRTPAMRSRFSWAMEPFRRDWQVVTGGKLESFGLIAALLNAYPHDRVLLSGLNMNLILSIAEAMHFRGEMQCLHTTADPDAHALQRKVYKLLKARGGSGNIFNANVSGLDLEEWSSRVRDGSLMLSDAGIDGVFDKVVVKAPQDAKTAEVHRFSYLKLMEEGEVVGHHKEEQVQRLSAAAKHVRKGGSLLYWTTSLEDEDTRHVIASFMATHKDFIVQVPESARKSLPFCEDGFLEVFPTDDGMAASFAAVSLARRKD